MVFFEEFLDIRIRTFSLRHELIVSHLLDIHVVPGFFQASWQYAQQRIPVQRFNGKIAGAGYREKSQIYHAVFDPVIYLIICTLEHLYGNAFVFSAKRLQDLRQPAGTDAGKHTDLYLPLF